MFLDFENIFMSKNSANFRQGGLDQFYTQPKVAERLVQSLMSYVSSDSLNSSYDIVIEPSAGAGAFLQPLSSLGKPLKALDVSPGHPAIEQIDFFDFQNDVPALYIGNPPYGYLSILASRFFNHAAGNAAELIAFIAPRTFRKESVQRRLDRRFHLVHDEDVPKNAFLHKGVQIDVPSAFQIWRKHSELREIQIQRTSEWITFTSPDQADFAIRRVGRKAGQLLEGLDHNPATTLFFTAAHPTVLDILSDNPEIARLADSAVGARSIAKSEIMKIVEIRMNLVQN